MIGSELTGGRARPSLAPGRGGREEEDVTEVAGRKCSFDAGLSRVTKKGLVSAWSRSPVAAAVDSVAAFTLKRSLGSMVLFRNAAKFSVQELCSMIKSPKKSIVWIDDKFQIKFEGRIADQLNRD